VPPRAVRTHPVYVAQGLLSPPVPGRSVVFALISWSISTAKDGLRTHGQIVARECVRLSSFPASGAYAARWSAAHSLGWTESEYLQDAVSNPGWRSRNV